MAAPQFLIPGVIAAAIALLFLLLPARALMERWTIKNGDRAEPSAAYATYLKVLGAFFLVIAGVCVTAAFVPPAPAPLPTYSALPSSAADPTSVTARAAMLPVRDELFAIVDASSEATLPEPVIIGCTSTEDLWLSAPAVALGVAIDEQGVIDGIREDFASRAGWSSRSPEPLSIELTHAEIGTFTVGFFDSPAGARSYRVIAESVCFPHRP